MTLRQRALLIGLVDQAAKQEAERVRRMKNRPSGTHKPEAIIAAEAMALELDALSVALAGLH